MISSETTTESRLRAVEDHIAICQVVAGYGYAVDGLNGEAVGSFYAEDGVYAVGDVGRYEGRDAVAGITASPPHMARVGRGCAHVSTSPYVVIDGDRAVATCHTMVMGHGVDGFYVDRLSASRIQLSRSAQGGWQIDHRQNNLLNGDSAAPALLARLKEGPGQD
jgi:ketosteroid isomerase-like protein